MTVDVITASSVFINSVNETIHSKYTDSDISMDSWVIATIDNDSFNFVPLIYNSHEEAKKAASALSKELPGQSIMIFRTMERLKFMKYED